VITYEKRSGKFPSGELSRRPGSPSVEALPHPLSSLEI